MKTKNYLLGSLMVHLERSDNKSTKQSDVNLHTLLVEVPQATAN